jgi:hypothetical protein
MHVSVAVLQYDPRAYANAGETEVMRLATVVRRAGGFEDLGSAIGGSNATAFGGFEDLGSAIGGSNATASGGLEDVGSGIDELRTIEGGGSRVLDIVPAENTVDRWPVRKAKCDFSFRQDGLAESNGAPEASNPEVINESIIT